MKDLFKFHFLLFLFMTIASSKYVLAEIDFDKVKERYDSALRKDYVLIPYNGTYLLPFSYNASPNESPYKTFTELESFKERGSYNRNLEAEFQISFLVLGSKDVFFPKLDFFIGYTQQSWWQIYNDDWSRPFRETNYAPEVFFRKNQIDSDYKFLGGKVPMFDFGYIHQSNGQVQELSRSWDRIFFRTVIDYKSFTLKPIIWFRIPEKNKENDNPDIQNYLGTGSLKIFKNFHKGNQISLKIIPGYKRAGLELDYSSPWTRGYRFYAKISSGTGLSLQDYDHEGNKVGIGFILNDIITSED